MAETNEELLDQSERDLDKAYREIEKLKAHSCLTSPRVVELVEAAKDFLYKVDDLASADRKAEPAVASAKADRLRTALAAFKGEK